MTAPVVIHLHRQAPAKPAVGEACNGCGVCCALETCPLALLRFRQRRGPCPALEWNGERYRCGLLLRPRHYWPWLPASWAAPWQRWSARWIASGIGCDCSAEAEGPAD